MEPKVGSGCIKTEDIEELKDLINPNFALINASSVCGLLHLRQAAYLSENAHTGNYNLAKDKSTEVLLYLTGQRQISKAIELGGINNTHKSVAWVSFGELPSKLSELVSLDSSVISHDNFDFSVLDLDEKLASKLSSTEKQKMIMTRTATLPVKPR